MAYPAPTASALTTAELQSTFTEGGTPATFTDSWGNQNPDFDGINDRYFDIGQNGGLFPSGAQHSLSFFLTLGSAESGSPVTIVNQRVSGSDIDFNFYKEAVDILWFVSYTGTTSNSYTVKTAGTYADGVEIHVILTWNTNAVKIYVNGIDVTVFHQQSGTGYTGMSDSTFFYGSNSSGSFGKFKGARMNWWVGTELTAAQALEVYTDEAAGPPAGASSGVYSSVYPSTLLGESISKVY